MNWPAGFGPMPFRRAGKLMLPIGILALILVGISKLTGWFTLPSGALLFGLAVILVSLHLIFLSPSE